MFRRLSSALALAALLIPVLPAQAADFYVNTVFSASNQVLSPNNAVGAPDGAFADFRQKAAALVLDFGEGEEGTGELVMTMSMLQFGATYRVEFLSEDFLVLQTAGRGFPLQATEERVAYTGGVPYRYVRFSSVNDSLWRLDAVATTSITTPDAGPLPEPEQPPTEAPVGSPAQGLLLKLPDDGLVSTTVDSAVYAVGADGRRHAFPSLAVYNSWYAGFEDLTYIDIDRIGTYELGKNVTVRPGTYLVKLTTDPKVYAVEPGGVLRWVMTENIASTLFGTNWNDRVIDVPDTFFTNYTIGDPIASLIHPDGSVGVLPTGEVVYIKDAVYYGISGDVGTALRFRSEFYVPIAQTQAELYGRAGELTLDPSIQFPF